MNTKEAGSSDEPQEYITVLALMVSETIKECVVLRIADREEKGAYAKARQICRAITAKHPTDCARHDYPAHPYWNVLTVQKEYGQDGMADLCLEDDISKLDSRWLANVLGVRRCTEYWTKVLQGEIVA